MLHEKSLRFRATTLAIALAVLSHPRNAQAGDDAASCIAASEDGQKLRDEGHYLRAHTSFTSCAHEACPAQIRSDCLQWLDDVDKKTPTVVLSARDSGHDVTDVKVSVDGVPWVDQLDGRPLLLDPGAHRLHWSYRTEQPFDEQVVLRAGEKNRPISAKFGADPVPIQPGPPALAFVLSGVAIVGAGAFAILGASGLHEIKTCNDDPSCDRDSSKSKTLTEFVIADSSLAVGITAGVIATYLFLKHRDPVMPDQHVTAGITPIPNGAAGSFSLEF